MALLFVELMSLWSHRVLTDLIHFLWSRLSFFVSVCVVTFTDGAASVFVWFPVGPEPGSDQRPPSSAGGRPEGEAGVSGEGRFFFLFLGLKNTN